MNSSRKTLNSAILGALIAISVLAHIVNANSELDRLAMQFDVGFNLASKGLGMNSPNTDKQLSLVEEADQRMRLLYSTLEKNLAEARQKSALARSSLASYTIDKLLLS